MPKLDPKDYGLDMDMPISKENKEEMRRARDEKERRKKEDKAPTTRTTMGEKYRKGGKVKSSASKRADGVAKKGKTRGKMV
jgi:hypothetical protein